MTIRLVLFAAALLGLAACGRQGDLERPAPLFGERARAEYEAERRRGADAPDETSAAENEREDAKPRLPDSTEPLRLPVEPRPNAGA
jgi:hypothetical protein